MVRRKRITAGVGLMLLGLTAFWPWRAEAREVSDAMKAPVTGEWILQEAGIEGGFVVHLHCDEAQLTAQIGQGDRYHVQGLCTDPKQVQAARGRLRKEGVYGQVTVGHFEGKNLPYQDDLVNLVVAERLGEVPRREVMRILAPRGVALIKREGVWTKTIKPRPEDIDNWTHYLHDASGNAVAADERIGHPKRLRWKSGPQWSRSHEFNPSINALVSAGGRMFYLHDQGMLGLTDLRFPSRWSLVARDAFNGKLLWKRPISNWGYREWNTVGMWSAPLTLNRRVVTDGDRVYVTLGYDAPVTVLDAATGEKVRTIAKTRGTDEMLLSDGILVFCVREKLSVAAPPKKKPKRRKNPHEYPLGAPGTAELVAVDAETGKELWRREPVPINVLALAALDGRICFHADNAISCIDLQTGESLWRTKCPGGRHSRFSVGTLVMHGDTVLFTGRTGLVALSAENGDRLWTGPPVRGPGVTHPPDLFVADGLVWTGYKAGAHSRDRTHVRREGLNPKTGKVEKEIEISKLISPLHHFRCYRSKATNDFLMLGKRGIEFVDLHGNQHTRCDWLRAMCHYGFLPCNGLLYIPPHHCFCYPGVKLTGFLAFTSGKGASQPQQALTSDAPRVVHGPAWETIDELSGTKTTEADWTTYRGDPQRRGSTAMELDAQLQESWKVKLAGQITPPVAAGQRVYVAEEDKHRLVCLDAGTGKQLWDFTAGGRVDSPPTIHNGLALFGCRDGRVYAIRADNGQLAWRFRAADDERTIPVEGQFESPHPVSGSVLLLDNVVYFAAGRSSYLDSGLQLYGLDPKTGEILHHAEIDSRWPDVRQETGRPFDMEGTKSDILVTDGNHIFLYQMAFDKQLNDVTGERVTPLGDRFCGRHLMATGGFLEDCWYNRTFWTYSNRWPGFYFANAAPKTGQILVVNDTTTYGLHMFNERARLSPTFKPGTGYTLFADDNANEPQLTKRSAGREKGPGFSRAAPPLWSQDIALRARAMLLAADKLFMAGPPDVVPEDDPYAAFEGGLGAELWVFSARDGKKLKEYSMDHLPAFDGLIAARGRLYLSTEDGTLLTWETP